MNKASTSTLIHEVSLAMDRIADHKLQETVGIPYSRFMFLYIVRQLGSTTQHSLAQALKVSDPAVSKLCAKGAQDGLLHIAVNPRHKRQRLVSLTDAGLATLQQSLAVLDACFSTICSRSQINEPSYRRQTAQLLHYLNDEYSKIMGGNHD